MDSKSLEMLEKGTTFNLGKMHEGRQIHIRNPQSDKLPHGKGVWEFLLFPPTVFMGSVETEGFPH